MTINIIFDADDTLWYTEFLYDEARARFAKLLSERGLGDPTEISELSRTIDDDNFSAYRFSRRRFPTSLHETYENLCFELEIASDPELVKEIKKICSNMKAVLKLL